MTKTVALIPVFAQIGEALQLEPQRTYYIKDGVVDRIIRYHVPKAAIGGKYDHTLIVTVYHDGTFATALDDGKLRVDDAITAIKAMALAAEGAKA